MKDVTIGDRMYRLVVVKRDDEWIAHAERADSGDRFGIECVGTDEIEVASRLTAWLAWQHEHADALDALQCAERAYHRTIAGSAFASASEEPAAIELQRESLELVERARVRLDEVRALKPW